MEQLILSLDIGTTIIKCVLFNTAWQEIHVAQTRCHLIFPQTDYVEIDPEEIWSAVVTTIQRSRNSLKPHQQIAALVVTTQGGSVLPVDQSGYPTNHLITWLDKRAHPLVQQWTRDGTSQRIRKISGWSPQPGLPLSLITWFKQNQAAVFTKSAMWLGVNDFIIHKLTGLYVTNPSMAGEMLLADIQKCAWDEELCALAGINPTQLSPILASDTIVGTITEEISKLTGLEKGLPVVNGGQDHACEALAFGAINANNTILACGTAWVINTVTTHGSADAIPPQMDLNFHVLPNKWLASQFLGELGSYPEWAIRQLWSPTNNFKSMNAGLLGKQIIHDGLFFLPLNGSRNYAGSADFGGFYGLRLEHDRIDMSRAILENAAFELRFALEQLNQSDYPIQKMWLIGGAASSLVWPKILADVCDVEMILTAYTHGPALGAAMLGWLSVGVFENPTESLQNLNMEKKRIIPDKDLHQQYLIKFEKYKNITHALSNLRNPN